VKKEKIISGFITKEIFRFFIYTLLVLLSIVFLNQVYLVIKESLNYPYLIHEIFLIILLKTLSDIPILIGISLFIGLIFAMATLTKNSEIYALKAASIDEIFFIKIISKFILIILITSSILVFLVSPLINHYVDNLRNNAYENLSKITIKAGKFHNFNHGKIVVYSENVKNSNVSFDQDLENIFLNFVSDKEILFITAASGSKNVTSGNVFFELKNGKKYKFNDDLAHPVIFSFDKLITSVVKNTPTKHTELKSPLNFSIFKENLFWKISLVLSVIVLTFAALSIKFKTHRSSFGLHYLNASLIIFGYLATIIFVNSLVEDSLINIFEALIITHFVPLLFLFMKVNLVKF